MIDEQTVYQGRIYELQVVPSKSKTDFVPLL